MLYVALDHASRSASLALSYVNLLLLGYFGDILDNITAAAGASSILFGHSVEQNVLMSVLNVSRPFLNKFHTLIVKLGYDTMFF